MHLTAYCTLHSIKYIVYRIHLIVLTIARKGREGGVHRILHTSQCIVYSIHHVVITIAHKGREGMGVHLTSGNHILHTIHILHGMLYAIHFLHDIHTLIIIRCLY